MARDLYIDGRVLVSGAKGHLNLGNPVSLTQSIIQVVIPNIPALAVLPYTFQNGLTETVGTPSIVELGGTLLHDTTINGIGYELQLNATTLSNNAIDYQIESTNYSLKNGEITSIENAAFLNTCNLYSRLEMQMDMPATINGDFPSLFKGSKFSIDGYLPGNNPIGSGFYNLVGDDCVPYPMIQQSFKDSSSADYTVTGIELNSDVSIYHSYKTVVAEGSTSIDMEGSISIQATDSTPSLPSLFQRITVTNNAAPTFSGINDITNDPYSYTFPNITPNNGDIMIADATGKLQYKPLEMHVQAVAKIGGAVAQKAFFHIPFIENHVCTRINFVSENTVANNITIEIKDEHNARVLDTLVLVVSNTIAYWGGYTTLTVPLASANANRLWSAEITANSATPVTSLYLTLTFVPELV